MRLVELQLIAFGPFAGARLDFSSPLPGLHVIYGANEAGKSTALRAVRGFLYGIEPRTRDAHLHRMPDLRVGARVADEAGNLIELVRRKGNQRTLLDAHGKPVDEAVLARLLHGITEPLFSTAFGLDHDGLRRGGEALLAGGGELGESLLEAGLGSGALNQALRNLRAEAEQLFTPQAQVKPINQAIKAFTEAQRQGRDLASSAEAYDAQHQGIDEARRALAQLVEALHELKVRRHRLERARRALPLLARRRSLLEERRALGEVRLLPEQAEHQRLEGEREHADAQARIARLRAELVGLDARRGALQVPETLLADQSAIEALAEKLGSHRKAAQDEPRRVGELQHVEATIEAVQGRVGRGPALLDPASLRLGATVPARIHHLAQKKGSLVTQLAAVDDALVERRERLAAQRAKTRLEVPVPDLEPSRSTLVRVRREVALDERSRQLEEQLRRLDSQVQEQAAALGRWTGPVEALAGHPFPSLEVVEEHIAAVAESARVAARLDDEEAELAKRESALQVELDAIAREGAVPTDADLAAARVRRDRGFRLLHEAWRAGASPETRDESYDADRPLADAYQSEVTHSDEVADRLRREAERVMRHGRLLAEQAGAGRERQRLHAERARHQQRRDERVATWQSLWARSGVEPGTPAEMLAWLERLHTLVELAARQRECRNERTTVEQRVARHRDAILAVHAAAFAQGPALAAGGTTAELADLVDRLDQLVAAADRRAVERAGAEEAIAEIEAELRAKEHERQRHDQALRQWHAEWAEAVVPIGLTADAAPEEATALLDAITELLKHHDEAARLRRRIEGIRRDAREFAAEVERLVAAHAPDLAGHGAEDAAAQLHHRHQQGKSALAERGEIDRQIEGKRVELERESARREQAEARLRRQMETAGAADLEELRRREQQSSDARRLDADVRAVELQLFQAGEGTSVEALESDFGSLQPDTLDAECGDVDEQIRLGEEESAVLNRRIGSLEQGLLEFDAPSAAAQAADEAQEHLARLRGHLDRYLRVRLAVVLLEREVERYRKENQGPILGRASSLFRELTLDSFEAVRVGFDEADRAVLRCVRAGGREVGIDGLSEGTRDQLYLALRLASLERHLASEAILPLIVDDILVHFDDDRARASLRILGQLSERVQVLFFTHHARLVELAREAVPEERLRVHTLSQPALVAAATQS